MKATIRDLFGIGPNYPIEVKEGNHPMVPKVKSYIFRPGAMSDLMAWFLASKEPLLITGPTGSGKSSLVEQVAARLGQPLYTVPCHGQADTVDLFGRYVVRNGSMEWADGPLLAGIKDPAGAWVLLEEYDTLPPGVFVSLNALLEGRRFILPETGELVDPAANGARIICTGNTTGVDDTGGEYAGVLRQNQATMGRFVVMEVGYASPPEEEEVLIKHFPMFSRERIKVMTRVATLVRERYITGDMPVVFCTRTLLRWVYLTEFFKKKEGIGGDDWTSPLHHALDRAVGFKYNPTVREALHEIVQRVCGA